jgi:predicted ATP-dependent endonuclease of OLD family
MTLPYADIKVPENEYFQLYQFRETRGFRSLSLINLLIGQNNGGKSLFLRNLFRENIEEFNTTEFNNLSLRAMFLPEIQKFEQIFGDNIQSISGVNNNELELLFPANEEYLNKNSNLEKALSEIVKRGRQNRQINHTSTGVDMENIHAQMNMVAGDIEAKCEVLFNKLHFTSPKKYYIPILRGMRPLGGNSDSYEARTIQDYFKHPENTNSILNTKAQIIFTGISLYDILTRKLLGEPEDREDVENFQTFLSNYFFNNEQITLIPKTGGNTVHMKIGTEKQYALYELGDGLQNLIILTFNLFMEREPCVFFIEEPEMCLHPGYQRALLDAFRNRDHHQYFLTTHSNHFLDMSIESNDVSIYHFQKEVDGEKPNFVVTNYTNYDNNLLRDIGVRSTSVFLSNSTIWIEGVTDRLYLKVYMEKYLQSIEETEPTSFKEYSLFKEDFHYSFVEYQGSNITHWSFDNKVEAPEKISAMFVTAKAFVIADGDIATKGTRKEDLVNALGDRFFMLGCKEIENLIPEEIIRKLAETEFTKVDKPIDLIKFDEYSKTMSGIGEYLDSKLEIEDGNTVFATQSGTWKNKVNRCHQAVKIMENNDVEWELSAHLIGLCQLIYKHIHASNY